MRKIEFCDLSAQQSRIRDSLIPRIDKVLRSSQFILGPEVSELEDKLASFVGIKHCITCANGTDALQLALMVSNIGPGDEVITSPFSFFATVETILLVGAKPVFVDIDPHSYLLDHTKVESLISPRTKAILPVSLYGQTAELLELQKIAKRHKLLLIEDAAQSFGALHYQKKSCSMADISCTSFFPSKPLGCYGDGGALFTDNDETAQTLKQIRSHGQTKRYQHDLVGINSRLDTLQAAILLSKLEVFEDEIQLRNEVAAAYKSMLAKSRIKIPNISPYNLSAWAQYTIEVSHRDLVQKKLQEHGIPTAIHYPKPLHLQKPVQALAGNIPALPHAESASERVLSLPMHPYLEQDQIHFISEQVLRLTEA